MAVHTADPNLPLPILFVGHGSPVNALEDNPWSRGLLALAPRLPKPRAILSISAHWFIPGVFATGNAWPPTIHDFGGFPEALYRLRYPAPGSPELAKDVISRLGVLASGVTLDWGLDHGTWCVLRHLFPQADCPVVQLSLDSRRSPEDHLALARRLAPLRREGVLILASGNITHNLRHAFSAMQTGERQVPDWAAQFDADVAIALEHHDLRFLARALDTEEGRLTHPSPDHYLPLLYAAGAADGSELVHYPIQGFDLSSLSMRSVLWESRPPAG